MHSVQPPSELDAWKPQAGEILKEGKMLLPTIIFAQSRIQHPMPMPPPFINTITNTTNLDATEKNQPKKQIPLVLTLKNQQTYPCG